MDVEIDEFAEKLVDFLNEEGLWWDFITYMKSEGYDQEEFPPPYNEN